MPRSDDELRELLRERLDTVREAIERACTRSGRPSSSVTLVAVTKSVSTRVIRLAEELGLDQFGENRPQTLWAKAEALPGRSWHFIGHLQRNKIDRTLPLISVFHSVDSFRLLQAIEEFSSRSALRPRLLLEFNCSREEAKGGFAVEQLSEVAERCRELQHVELVGLMTMAAYDAEEEQIRATFRELRTLRDELRSRTGLSLPELSMGMSNDYEIAIEEGATMIRVGTTLFDGLADE